MRVSIQSNYLRPGLLLLAVSLFFSSCNALKKAGIGKKDDDLSSAKAVIAAISDQGLKADWLNAKAKISFKNPDMSVSGSATIRMKKDSLLWISVKKLGFEVARGMVTTDSVYILDRLNREYAVYGLDYLEKSYQLPGNFQMLQSVLLGEPYFFDAQSVDLDTEADHFLLRNTYYGHEVSYQVNQEDLKLVKLDYASQTGSQKMEINLEEYEELDDKQLFSYFRSLKMDSPDTGATDVTIKFSQVELDIPKDVQFRIPSRYTKMDD